MPSNPKKAEEMWEGRFHLAFDRGDICQDALLAAVIIGAFALLEVGIFSLSCSPQS